MLNFCRLCSWFWWVWQWHYLVKRSFFSVVWYPTCKKNLERFLLKGGSWAENRICMANAIDFIFMLRRLFLSLWLWVKCAYSSISNKRVESFIFFKKKILPASKKSFLSMYLFLSVCLYYIRLFEHTLLLES